CPNAHSLRAHQDFQPLPRNSVQVTHQSVAMPPLLVGTNQFFYGGKVPSRLRRVRRQSQAVFLFRFIGTLEPLSNFGIGGAHSRPRGGTLPKPPGGVPQTVLPVPPVTHTDRNRQCK